MKYTVQVTQTDVYQHYVEAANPDEAKIKALKEQIENPTAEAAFICCEDRTARVVGTTI